MRQTDYLLEEEHMASSPDTVMDGLEFVPAQSNRLCEGRGGLIASFSVRDQWWRGVNQLCAREQGTHMWPPPL